MAKKSMLDAVKASKPTGASSPNLTPAKADGGAVKHVMVRLNPAAHDVLRELSYVQRRPQSALLVEALNDLFTKNGKPPIAG